MPREVGQLDYAPTPAWPRRRAVRRYVTIALVLVAALLAVKWVPFAWNHIRLVHHQARCLEWSAPADQLLYQQHQVGAPWPDWSKFYSLLSPPGGKPAATLFAHEMRQKDGSPRLVVVEVPLTPSTPCNQEIDAHVIRPGGTWRRPQLLWQSTWFSPWYIVTRKDSRSLRLYAGQSDPVDPTHFTIRFAYLDHEGILDGWLQANDTILLEPRRVDAKE